MWSLLQEQMGTAWGPSKCDIPGTSPAQAASKISFPQMSYMYLLEMYVALDRSLETLILHTPHGEGSWSGLLHARCYLSLLVPFPNYSDYFTWGCLSGWLFLKLLSQRLSSETSKFSSPRNHLCLRYLGHNHFAFRGPFLIIHLYGAQFNRTLILAGAFLKPFYCHKSNSNNIQLQKLPAQASNTVWEQVGTSDSQEQKVVIEIRL